MPQYSYLQTTPAILLALALFFFLVLFYFLGHRFRQRLIRRRKELAQTDLKTINGMLLGLLGLMLAFTFSMSNERFDSRRSLIIEEANNIGTAVLRTDIFPDSLRALLRANLKQYLEERIAFYEVGMDLAQAAAHYRRADSLSSYVWSQVARYARVDRETVKTSEIVPALNAMIDITTTRRAAGEATLPASILYFLFVLSVGTAFLLGYEDKGPMDWVMILGFSVMLSATVFTIIDLDRPRSGIINMDVPHQRMVDVRGLFRP